MCILFIVTFPASFLFFFFFNDTATTEIYTLSLHDALPISRWRGRRNDGRAAPVPRAEHDAGHPAVRLRRSSARRSEEHTSELQSRSDLVCRLLLEKKKKNRIRLQYESNTSHAWQQPTCQTY